MRIELLWGHLRRAYLKTFRRGYVRRMAATRQGDHNQCPWDVLDPRDLKFYANRDIHANEEIRADYGDFAEPHGWAAMDL